MPIRTSHFVECQLPQRSINLNSYYRSLVCSLSNWKKAASAKPLAAKIRTEIKSAIEKHLVEVTTTTLWLALLIYSFQYRSAFQPRCQNWFSPSSLSLSAKKNIFILWPWPLTYKLDPGRVNVNRYAIRFKTYHWYIHTEPTDCSTDPQRGW